MVYKNQREEILKILAELFRKNLITSTGGNISTRNQHNPDQLWITPAAVYKGDLKPEQMVLIYSTGKPLQKTGLLPSSEWRLHAEIYKARPDINAVIHTHPLWTSLLVLTDTPFLPISTEAALIGEIPRISYSLPGTEALAEGAAKVLGNRLKAVFLKNHGLVAADADLRKAADITEIVERTSELIIRSLSLGKTPLNLPPEALEIIKNTEGIRG